MDSSKPGPASRCGGGHIGQVIQFTNYAVETLQLPPRTLPVLIRAARGTCAVYIGPTAFRPGLLLSWESDRSDVFILASAKLSGPGRVSIKKGISARKRSTKL